MLHSLNISKSLIEEKQRLGNSERFKGIEATLALHSQVPGPDRNIGNIALENLTGIVIEQCKKEIKC